MLNLPAVAGDLQNMPDVTERFQGLVTVFGESPDNDRTITDVSFVPIIWTLTGAGGVVLLAGLLGLAGVEPA